MRYLKLVPEIFIWWYSRGVKDLFSFLSSLYQRIQKLFSLKEILSTFFSPWKKLVGARAPGIDGLKDWLLDNLLSRGVGVVMRTLLLLLFLISNILYLLFSLVAIILWFGMPAVIVFSFIYLFVGYK